MTETTTPASEGTSYRLPRSVVPEHYRLRLTPDLVTATFAGEETVQVVVQEPVRQFVLNAVELSIDSARLRNAIGLSLDGTVAFDEAEERATIAFPTTVAPGEWQLDIVFRGTLNDKLRGFYRSTFKDQAGQEQVVAVTQFESTDARRAFPCWDEPDFKASFGVTLVVGEGLLAISNGREIASVPLESGKRAVTFADTMKMSTYLVAFIVGPFEATPPVDVQGTPLRVVMPLGKLHLSPFALKAGEHALTFFADYFGIPYPGDKLDLIAVPDFTFGAMENLGAVTFRETALLVDESQATRNELERIADVVAHEIAHMWFGDLVTMRWWNGIWLNEAFATFMEMLCVDAWRPEWHRWDSFGLSRTAAMLTDGLKTTRPIEYPVRRPSEASDMFDVLTYEKGASVLRMLEQYLGPATFKRGISSYVARHQYRNTETTDLWDSIEAAASEPVRTIMDGWVYQAGFPIVSVRETELGVVINQLMFRYLRDSESPATRWQIPVVIRVETASGPELVRALVDRDEVAVELPKDSGAVVVNVDGSGFYRVRYSPALLGRLRAGLGNLTAIERYNLVDNTWAATVAGIAPVRDFLDLAEGFQDETDSNVWTVLVGGFAYLKRAVDADLKPFVAAKLASLLLPMANRLGWEPANGEDDLTRQLRGTILGALGTTAEHPATQAEAKRRYERYLGDRGSLDPNLVPAVVETVAYTGDAGEYLKFVERYRTASTPQEEMRYLTALAAFRDRDLIAQTLEKTLNGEVRTQNAMIVIARCMANPVAGEVAWEFAKTNWRTFEEKFPERALSRSVEGLAVVFDRPIADDAEQFFRDHPVREGGKIISQVLERQRIGVDFKAREAENLRGLFAGA